MFTGVIESYMSEIPMIIITADRPKKLIGTGTNQTIYQNKIFGRYAHFFNLSPHIKNTQEYFNNFINFHDGRIDFFQDKLFEYLCEIYATCEYGPYDPSNGEYSPIPVHLNLPFDEPLYTAVSHRMNIRPSKKIIWIFIILEYGIITLIGDLIIQEY